LTTDGTRFVPKNSTRSYTLEDLLKRAEAAPDLFSPNVLLRPILQQGVQLPCIIWDQEAQKAKIDEVVCTGQVYLPTIGYIMTVPDGPYKGFVGEEPEYEDWAAWGPLIGNTDVIFHGDPESPSINNLLKYSKIINKR
jgi:hypothetical protein